MGRHSQYRLSDLAGAHEIVRAFARLYLSLNRVVELSELV